MNRRPFLTAALLPAALVVSALGASACLRSEVPEFREGIAAYGEGRFADAEQHFERALEAEPSPEGHFDKGAAIHRQQKPADAAEELRKALSTRDDAFRSRVYLNLGNSEATAGNIDGAIRSYRRALELVPDDHDARYNLEWALRMKRDSDGSPSSEPGDSGEEGDRKEDQQQNQGQDRQAAKQDQPNQGDSAQDGAKQPQPGGDKPQEQQAQAQDGQQQRADSGAPDEPAGERPSSAESTPGESEPDPSQQAQAAGGAQPQQDAMEKARAVGRHEATEILDALRAAEQNFPFWRFQARERKERRSVEKDW